MAHKFIKFSKENLQNKIFDKHKGNIFTVAANFNF